MKVLDLFSGIGGFSLGLEAAGMTTIAFCEPDEYARRVLRKHWPHVRCYVNVATLTAERLQADGIERPDVVCGGFPCQDISSAGNRIGIEGARSGLWREFARIIGETRPHYALVENVSALRSRGFGKVLSDLAALGYDTEWHCIPASHLGAPHERDRIWIIAYPDSDNLRSSLTDALADTTGERRQEKLECQPIEPAHRIAGSCDVRRPGGWTAEPDVGRVADGIPARVDRLRTLGNAVVPAVVELLGRAILEHART